MDTPTEPAGLRPPLTLRRLERACLAVAAVVATLTLMAWLSSPSVHVAEGWAMMKPVTALCMLLAAAAVWVSATAARWRTEFLLGCSALLVFLSAAALTGLLPGAGPGWTGDQSLGLISPQSVLGLLLLGSSLPLMGIFRGPLSIAADVLALLFADFMLVMLLGYLFATPAFGESSAIHMAPPTFVCFLMFAVIVMARRSGGGALAVLRGDGIGSRIVRVAIPLAIVLLLSLTVVRSYVVYAGLVAPAYASAAAVSFICFCVTLLTLLMGWRINVLERSVRDLMQRRADTQLQESEQRYTELVEQAIVGILLRRPDGEILVANDAYCRLMGYDHDELMKMKIQQVIKGPDTGVIERTNALKMGESVMTNVHVHRKDGSQVFIEARTQRLRGGNLQSVVVDVSERKRMEQARDEIERRYMQLVEQAADAIWLRDATGQMLFVNQAACDLLGYTREDLLATHSSQLIHESDPDTANNIDALGPDQSLRTERVMRHRDGRAIPVEASLHRLQDGGIQVISHDITERKQAEDRERQHMEELRVMSQQLLDAQETERRAIARELHDEVGQSLTATRINLRDLETQMQGGPLAQRLTDASTIISDLLGKVRQMSLDLHPSVLDDLGLEAALRWCVRTRTTGSNLQVSLHVPPELPRFDGMMEVTLFRVFQEALSNVLKHAQATHLDVSVRHVPGSLELIMKDDGIGFDAEAARRHALSGKSLGLVGMQERVRLAGGRLVLESVPGQGTELRVWLSATER